jgi:hypothetical protein
MKKTLSKIIGSGIIASLLILPILSVRAEIENGQETKDIAIPLQSLERESVKQRTETTREAEKQRLEQIREAEKNRLEALKENRGSTTLNREIRVENREEIMGIRIERPLLRASSTELRLEKRENNILRIKERLASTTASTSVKRIENLDKRFDKQVEQMGKVKDRLLNKEVKILDVLGKISSKIQERINILTGKGLDMTASKAKLAEATLKAEEMTIEADNLTTLINTEITEANKDSLFQSIKASQEKIRTLARATHALLVDTIKEITKVLPRNDKATSTATSTN